MNNPIYPNSNELLKEAGKQPVSKILIFSTFWLLFWLGMAYEITK